MSGSFGKMATRVIATGAAKVSACCPVRPAVLGWTRDTSLDLGTEGVGITEILGTMSSEVVNGSDVQLARIAQTITTPTRSTSVDLLGAVMVISRLDGFQNFNRTGNLAAAFDFQLSISNNAGYTTSSTDD